MSGNSVKKNIAYNSCYNILVILIPFVLNPYVSRKLGAEGIGVYSFTLAVANYFKRASLLGNEKYGNRSIALVKENYAEKRNSFWSIYKVQFLFSLACILMYSLYLVLWNTRGVSSTIQLLFIFSSTFDVSWFYFGQEKFKPVIFLNTVFKVLYLITTFVFVNSQNDVNVYIFLSALSYFLPSFLLFIYTLFTVTYVKSSYVDLVNVLKGTLVLFIPVIAVTVYKSMDKLMLGIMSSTAYENGIYENSEKILHVPIAVITAVSTVLMPRMTSLFYKKDDDGAKKYISLTVLYSSFIAMAATFGIIGISSIFTSVYWGEGFEECSLLLKLFSVSVPFMSLAEIIRTQYIIPNKLDSFYVKAVIIGAIINLLVNLALIPRYGAEGAVIGTIVAEASVCIFQLFKVRRFLPVTSYCLYYLKFIPPGLAMGVLLLFITEHVNYSIANLVISFIIGSILYFVFALIMLKLFDKHSFNQITGVTKKLINRKG